MNSAVKPSGTQIAVVIPCYKVTAQVAKVIARIGQPVTRIYIIDDGCPNGSGKYVEENCRDERLKVIYHPANQGVGGAVMTGYQAAVDDGMDIIVKLDGDGQMDPGLIDDFVNPILLGEADYTKGNRFYDLEAIRSMPKIRLFGNAVLSFMTKLSSGYWNLFDPTNGYTAIHSDVIRHLPLRKISRRYFFETDMLFRLNILRAVVIDIPMDAKYGDEVSNLKIRKILPEFLYKHCVNFGKRVFYNYYLRDMSMGSIDLPVGLLMFLFGVIYGSYHWALSSQTGQQTAPGTVMLAALPVITGLQLILAFISHDINTVPTRIFHHRKRKPNITL